MPGLANLLWVLGSYVGVLACCLLLPLCWALAQDPTAVGIFQKSLLVTVLAAALLLLLGRRREARELREREAILLVVLVWLAVCGFSALPFVFSPAYASATDALFEATSGLTTTGATVLERVEVPGPALQLWRCFTHWLGGMGIVVLGLAVLPLLAHGSQGLYRAEFSGAAAQRLRPRIREVAAALWKIYLLLTALLCGALYVAGMTPLEALCHSFSTLGSGGFSTRTESIAGFDSPLIEYILIVFMLFAGISFVQHYRFWLQGKVGKVLGDYELRAFAALVATATLPIAVLLYRESGDWEPALRAALFQVVSISTTTGFASADFAQWQPLAQMLLLTLMFVGGCTGSTAGGLKVARAVLLGRVIRREFLRISEPQGIFRIRVGGEVLGEDTVHALLNLIYLAGIFLLVASIAITATGIDVFTALAAVVACQFNVGPGLGGVGPLESYAFFSDPAKWVLMACMIAGRLEFYTLLVVFSRHFWRQ
jgi:trk system potassium uptake protein TrkH